MLDNHNNEEYLKGLIELQDDSKYINEIAPAYAFSANAPNYLKVIDIKKNEKEYEFPDFFLELQKNKLINFEVTALLDELIPETNNFLKKLEKITIPLIEQHKNLLPPGAYNVIPFCGKDKISDTRLEKILKLNIPKWFKDYAENGSTDYIIYNNTGNHFGKLIISKLFSAEETKISMWRQGVSWIKSWTLKNLEKKLQESVYKKEKKYLNKYSGICWLLISDRENLMNTSDLDFSIAKISLKTKFFKKIFLIRYENIIDELNLQIT